MQRTKVKAVKNVTERGTIFSLSTVLHHLGYSRSLKTVGLNGLHDFSLISGFSRFGSDPGGPWAFPHWLFVPYHKN